MNTVMAATSAFRHGEYSSASTATATSGGGGGFPGSISPSSLSFPGSSLLFPHGHPSQPAPQQQLMRPGDQKVSPVPDVIIQSRDPSHDEFILVACDGIWDVLTNYEAVQTVAELFREGETDLGLVCEEVRSIERPRAGSRPLACVRRRARPRVE
jgi:serine/threonine protein phosphatase PrpC